MQDILKTLEDPDIRDDNEVQVVYIPLEVWELTDKKAIDVDLICEEQLEKDIAGTFEIHTSTDIPRTANPVMPEHETPSPPKKT